uniref:AMP-dependent synthetase/ligase domain-containing protein n=1 Tax=Chromera velia CCMP2878 TaxID=1169474 RepID=A0A0G4HZ73_9ALVE|eukprot:Cvel_9659.t1-p1 / transcript=Cvel_9659.t1 / gene=Cvel_9659 / organism=Chromera_velia_CCMP2878 / gene_product=Probable acyl-activating enzyme 16, chloroplastic, putative / transcript_product=Probable acyl-activating enzyme 16, chloroplastic, putative / location=Cvel_scaffold562:47542-56659(-) / protein_length=759 / sequence_SO=supercontig / SO=protein_coding / is_pseudo=false
MRGRVCCLLTVALLGTSSETAVLKEGPTAFQSSLGGFSHSPLFSATSRSSRVVSSSLNANTLAGFATEEYPPHPIIPRLGAVHEVWGHVAEKFPDSVALHDPYKPTKSGVKYTFRQLTDAVQDLSLGLKELGIRKGDAIGLFAENTHRCFLSDQGIMGAGAVSVPRGAFADKAEVEYILRHSGSKACFFETTDQLYHIIIHLKQTDEGRKILEEQLSTAVLMYPPELDKSETEMEQFAVVKKTVKNLYSFEDVLKKGAKAKSEGRTQLPSCTADDLAVIMYTSGTTGQPKGVMLSHGNLLHQVYLNSFNDDAHKEGPGSVNPLPGDTFLTILPTWHIFERVAEYWGLARAAQIVYTTRLHFRQDLSKYAPEYLIAVPRLFETIQQGVEKRIRQGSKMKRLIAKTLRGASETYIKSRRICFGEDLECVEPTTAQLVKAYMNRFFLYPLHLGCDAAIWKKVRDGLGNNMKAAIAGGAALAMKVENFFECADVLLIEGYGLTETSPTLFNRRKEQNMRGSVGVPVAMTEAKIVDIETGVTIDYPNRPGGPGKMKKGLVVVRGPQVMQGYFKNEEATAKVLSPDGWFVTGDLGQIMPSGELQLTGRQKDVIVLSNGENIEPEPLEITVAASALVDQIVCIGQDRRFLAALIVPNLDQMVHDELISQKLADEITQKIENGDEEGLREIADQLEKNAIVDKAIKSEILSRLGKRKNKDELIKAYRLVLSPFTPDNGLVTQTMKVKRDQVFARFEGLIESIYSREN